MNAPNGPETPKGPPRPEAEARLSKENISPPAGEPMPWEENIVSLAGLEGYEAMRRTRTDWAPFYWAPRSLWSE
jgi:hypothetical protein